MSTVMNEQMVVSMTNTATQRVSTIIAQKKKSLMLRVFVKGGGCSGFQYGFQFEEQSEEDDVHFNIGEVKLLIYSMSLQYLTGSEIDFLDDLMGSRFVVNNPNASTTCGCGSSFSL